VTLNILVADDHAIFRKGLIEVLNGLSQNNQVAEAADGAEALTLGLEQNWDVVILDIAMPGLTGIQVLRKLTALKPNLPVIMLSAHGGWDYMSHCLEAGAAGYLTKESAPGELLAAVHTVLDGNTYITRGLRQDTLASPRAGADA
jgi:DNA-binding NarL/FixJ family response regulator